MSEKKETTNPKKVKPKKEPAFKFVAKNIPTDSGCYLYYDKDDRLLYVGKAKHLRKRVTSYFQKTKKSPKTELMVSKIRRIETRITNSEIESLILENNLIKEFRPRFNILLRDDKSFLYLRITKEDFPRLEITRRIVRDGSFYVGPKTSAKSFRKTIAFCQKVFRIRDCKLKMEISPNKELKVLKNPENRKLPCMDFHIKKCSGPCSEEITAEEYQADITAMKKFLRGDTADVIKSLQAKMMGFAETQNFEAAGKIRDLIQSIEVSTQKQTVQLDMNFEADFIHFYRQKKTAHVVRVLFRGGKFLDQNEVTFSAPALATDEEILEKFLIQFYEKVDEIPKTIYVPMELEDEAKIGAFFQSLEITETAPQIIIPQKGDKKKILDMAYKNARNIAKKAEIETMSQAENFSKALPNLAKVLGMEKPPRRIECYDISHYSGSFPVASQVVFIDGKPKNSEYRRYHVKSLPDKKIDDFASMEEVLGRRFKRTQKTEPKVLHPELTMKPVESDDEWDTYHTIRKKEIFDRYLPDLEYDRDHKDEKKKKNHSFIFCLDEEIIGTVRLDEKPKKQVILRLLAITTPLQKKKYGTRAIELIEDWCQEKKAKTLVFNAANDSIDFYLKTGFEKDFWPGDAEDEHNTPMGKTLQLKKERWELPDLVVIDGGKGQLSSVMKVFKDLTVEGFNPETQIISLAKREEQIFRPGNSDPIELDWNDPALKLLQRVRDEAHRFAISFNRSLRQKNATKSALDSVPGIGGVTKKKLMTKFETVSGIRNAGDEALLKVINQKQLTSLRKFL